MQYAITPKAAIAGMKNNMRKHLSLDLQQIPIKPATKEPTEKAQSRCHNDETN
jgi:hypothetical protein